MNKNNYLIPSAILLVAIVISSIIIGGSIERFKKEDRYISVKGFAERDVKADLAVWTIKIRIPCDNLSSGSGATESAKNKVVDFLIKNGIVKEEIIQKEIKVVDRQATDYTDPNAKSGFRYIITKSIQVRSKNVDVVKKVSEMTDELIKSDVALSAQNEWQDNGLQFIFTGLSKIKPDMLAEAIKNAKTAAVQFTSESATSLGKMRKGNQGLFSIIDRDANMGNQQVEGGYSSGTNEVMKKVRVVISVDYFID